MRAPPSERNHGEWTVIKRRRRQSPSENTPPIACKTIYIDFLPLEINPQTLRFIFNPYGSISSIVIPYKIRDNCNHRYAFIKYLSTHSLMGAISHENGRRIGNFKLKVSPAKYDSPTHTTLNPPLKPHTVQPKNNLPSKNHRAATRDHRSYKEAATFPPLELHNTTKSPSTKPTTYEFVRIYKSRPTLTKTPTKDTTQPRS